MQRLTVLINVLNEAKNLPRVISSIKSLASEIVVIDLESTDDSVKIAKKLGFYFCKQEGSHETWRRDVDGRRTTIPNHGNKTLKRKTLKAILEDFKISAEEFIRLRKGK